MVVDDATKSAIIALAGVLYTAWKNYQQKLREDQIAERKLDLEASQSENDRSIKIIELQATQLSPLLMKHIDNLEDEIKRVSADRDRLQGDNDRLRAAQAQSKPATAATQTQE